MNVIGKRLPSLVAAGSQLLPHIGASPLHSMRIETANPAAVRDSLLEMRKYFEKPTEHGFDSLVQCAKRLDSESKNTSLPPQERYFCHEVYRAIKGLMELARGFKISSDNLRSASLHGVMREKRKSDLQDALRRACNWQHSHEGGTLVGAALAAPTSVWEEIFAGRPSKVCVLWEMNEELRRPTDCALTSEEIFAIADYVHPHTYTSPVSAAGRLSHLGFPDMRDALNFYIAPLESGIEKLANDPRFSADKSTLYRGVNIQGPGQKEYIAQALQRSIAHYLPYMLPHIVSTSEHKDCAFTYRRGYDLRLDFDPMKAARVGFFNLGVLDTEREVIIPHHPNGFTVVSTSVEEVEDGLKDYEPLLPEDEMRYRGRKQIEVVRLRAN